MVFYVTEQGAEIGIQRARLEVRKGGHVLDSVRLDQLEQVALYGIIQISTQAMRSLLQRGIDICLLSQSGAFLGRLSGWMRKNVMLRHIQHQQLSQPEACLTLARRMVAGKLHNQRVVLLRYQRKLQNDRMTQALLSIRLRTEQIETVADLDTLRGLEGAAAASYFGVFNQMLSAPGITFSQRIRRPPPDPTNILLSFGYTLLGNLIQGYLELASLDPYLGAYHQMHYGRPSLALDLLEEWRPVIVDIAVLRALNTRSIRPEHFVPADPNEHSFDDTSDIDDEPIVSKPSQDRSISTNDGLITSDNPEEPEEPSSGSRKRPLILLPEGSKRWFAIYERRLNEEIFYPPQQRNLSYRQIIREQVFLLARHLRDIQEYQPFLLRD